MQFLRTKLASHVKPFLIAVIVLLQLQSVYVAFSLSSSIQDRTNIYLEESAQLASSIIGNRIAQVTSSLERLGHAVSERLDSDGGPASCAKLLHSYKTLWQYSDIFLLAPDGTQMIRSEHNVSADAVLARRAVEQKKIIFGKSSRESCITYAVPILRDGEVIAVLMASRGTEKAYQILNIRVLSDAGVIMLVDARGNILVKHWASLSEDLRTHVNFFGQKDKLNTALFGKGYDLQSDLHLSFKDSHGHKWLMAQHTLEDFGITLIYAAPANVLMQNIPSLNTWNSMMGLVSFLLIILLIADLLWLERAYRRKLDEVEYKDVLTGGDNAARFSTKLKSLLERGGDYALITMDFNKFKLINDEYGVGKANDLLRLTHKVFSSRLAEGELCARHNADTFLLLLRYRHEADLRERISGMMHEVMERKHALGIQHKYGLSAGVYVIDDRDMDPYPMVDHANIAREQCKKPPYPPCVFYDESVQKSLRCEAEILNSLNYSLENDCFEIWLQPKVNIRTDIVTGAEALVRWKHPTKGFLPPGIFLPVLERHNRIVQVDLWVFEQVCRLLARWDKEGREIVPIAVNLSRTHLSDDNFFNNYLEILQKYKINPHWIELELTETIFMENEERIAQIFSSIRSHGMRCAIDDFGTGYSSLSLLKNTSVDTVKLDQSFFSSETLSEQSKAIIRSITQLASALSLTCVAEGVEHCSSLEFLLSTDCSIVQGYLYSKPLTVEAFEKFCFSAEGRRQLLNSSFLNEHDRHEALISAKRGHQMRELFSSIHCVGFSVVKKPTCEILYSNDFMNSLVPKTEEGRFCHEVWPDTCTDCPLEKVVDGKSPTILYPASRFGMPVRMTITEIMWEENTPAYVITLVPISLGEEEIARMRSQMADWKQKANEDPLTRLLTKTRFEKEVTRRLEKDVQGVLLFIDLDGFKLVNDSLGHQMGDEVLKNTAERIRLSFRGNDLIGRYGGDEFVVYASGFPDEDALDRRLENLKNLLRLQHMVNGVTTGVSASIGVTRFPADADNFDELLRKADIALYEAKRRGKDQHVHYRDCAELWPL